MKKLIILFVITIVIAISGCGKKEKTVSLNSTSDTVKAKTEKTTPKSEENPCLKFDELNKKILDRKVKKDEALPELKKLFQEISDYYDKNGGIKYTINDWRFPLDGYSYNAIGGKDGNGYVPGGYNYFDGNKHTGHPAQDIFIHDSNQDNKDDGTGKYVNVLSVTGGIIISCENNWDPKGDGRGGNYIWCFCPYDNTVVYYAHNREIFVKPGDIVKPGDKIAYVGRTGVNAAPSRSPTHLHISLFTVKDGYPVPENIYQNLKKSKLSYD